MFPPSWWINCHLVAGEQQHGRSELHPVKHQGSWTCFCSAHKHIQNTSSLLGRAQESTLSKWGRWSASAECFDKEDAVTMFCPINTIRQWWLSLSKHWSAQPSFHLFLHKRATNLLVSQGHVIPSAVRQHACKWTSTFWRTGRKIRTAFFNWKKLSFCALGISETWSCTNWGTV